MRAHTHTRTHTHTHTPTDLRSHLTVESPEWGRAMKSLENPAPEHGLSNVN